MDCGWHVLPPYPQSANPALSISLRLRAMMSSSCSCACVPTFMKMMPAPGCRISDNVFLQELESIFVVVGFAVVHALALTDVANAKRLFATVEILEFRGIGDGLA